jgi:hypothetical protein
MHLYFMHSFPAFCYFLPLRFKYSRTLFLNAPNFPPISRETKVYTHTEQIQL